MFWDFWINNGEILKRKYSTTRKQSAISRVSEIKSKKTLQGVVYRMIHNYDKKIKINKMTEFLKQNLEFC